MLFIFILRSYRAAGDGRMRRIGRNIGLFPVSYVPRVLKHDIGPTLAALLLPSPFSRCTSAEIDGTPGACRHMTQQLVVVPLVYVVKGCTAQTSPFAS